MIWRIVSQRKIMSPEGGINYPGRQSVISHSYKVYNCFITSNILYSAIIIWFSSYLTTDTKWWPIFSTSILIFTMEYTMKSSRNIIQLSHAVDITMRRNVQRLIERNVKCHVTFFRLIKFNISIWLCNNTKYVFNIPNKRSLLNTIVTFI